MDKMFAVLVECDPSNSLGGSCYRDIFNIRDGLIARKFKEKNIFILSSSCIFQKIQNNHLEENCYLSHNINGVVNNISKQNPTLVYFHFSGHGYQKRDMNGDEKDNMDEYVNLNGMTLLDDDFYDLLKRYFSKYCKIRVGCDSCHSGTFSDFKYEFDGIDWINSSNRPSYFEDAYSISACSDQQLAMCDIGNNSGFGGSLTVHLLDSDDKTFDEFLTGDPKKAHKNLCDILKKLNQKSILCKD